jgi:L-alanine-DL-glutamate epimerase-like enolase superfamily enzyme
MIFYDMHMTIVNERSDIEHIWQFTWRIGFYRGGPVFMSALSGIDIALWDLKGMDWCKPGRLCAND